MSLFTIIIFFSSGMKIYRLTYIYSTLFHLSAIFLTFIPQKFSPLLPHIAEFKLLEVALYDLESYTNNEEGGN